VPIYTSPTPTFRDVPTTNPFYSWIETAAHNDIVSGYNCGGPGEPCPGVYFRPNNLVTRGQLSKITVVAAGWSLINPVNATFNDVERNSTFYTYIETLYCHGSISGYDCGAPGEPCPGKYFRPGNNATRGQISKIAYLSLTNPPTNCGVVAPTPTPVPGTCFNYTATAGTAALIPGTTDIGNHCDDCATTVQLPFTVTVYDRVFSQVYASSNGSAIFGVASPSLYNACLPDRNLQYAVVAAQDDECTAGCGGGACATCGIFTAVTGSAPNRQFIMEWRTIRYATTETLNYEVIFTEGSNTVSVVYGAMTGNGDEEIAGIQQTAQSRWTIYACREGVLTAGSKVDYVRSACP